MSKSPDAFRTISEVAEDLDLPQHVLRFWETRFTQIKPMKRGGGRRYYRPDDVELLRGIRHLLYGEGYTIRGVQRILKEQGGRFVVGAGRGEKVRLPERHPQDEDDEPEVARGAPPPPPIEARMQPVHFEEVGPDDEPMPEDEASEPVPLAPPSPRYRPMEAPVVRPPASRGMSGDDASRLRATLSELLECKRLLDGAR